MGRWRRLGERELLEISAPTSAEQFVRSFKFTVILICQHGFTAENKYELTTHKGDILKVLERPGNGWLLVQFIDTVNKYGLIPAKYVDIAVNDPLDPITLLWLHQVDEVSPTNSKLYNQAEDISNNNALMVRPISTHNKSYPKSASISNVLLLDNRYWYRLDITYSDNSKAYLPRYYEDFYNLHGSLLNMVGNIIDTNGITPSLLPKLPEPIPSTSSSQSNDLTVTLLKRCNDLNIYTNRLLNDKRFQRSKALYEWLDVSYRNLGGLICHLNYNLNNEEITKKILPYSVDILNKKASKNHDDNVTLSSPVTPITSAAFSERHDLNSIGQLGKDNTYKTIASRPPKLTINTSTHNYNDSVGSHSESIFSDIDSVKSPDTPFSLSHEVFALKHNYVKLKIIKQNDDIVALKIHRNDIKSVADLKRLIGAKLPYKSLYIKLHDFKHIDSHNYNFIQVLNESEKIVLRAT